MAAETVTVIVPVQASQWFCTACGERGPIHPDYSMGAVHGGAAVHESNCTKRKAARLAEGTP